MELLPVIMLTVFVLIGEAIYKFTFLWFMLVLWFIMLIAQWYLNDGRFYEVSATRYKLKAKNLFRELSIPMNKIVEIRKGGKVQVPLFRHVFIIRITYLNKNGKKRKLRYRSLKLMDHEIPNLEMYHKLFDESKLVNF